MDTNKIKELLVKYDNGETDIREEALLEQYFNETDSEIFPEWSSYATMFKWRRAFRKKELTESFDTTLLSKMTGSAVSNEHTQTTVIVPLLRRRIMQIAASVAILLACTWLLKSVWVGYNNPGSPQLAKEETFDDPELAYQQTVEALAFLSSKLNKGQRKASSSIGKLKTLDQAIPN